MEKFKLPEFPKRVDGTEYFFSGLIIDEDFKQASREYLKDLVEFARKTNNEFILATIMYDSDLKGWMFDNSLTGHRGKQGKIITISDFYKLHSIMNDKKNINKDEKLLMAQMPENGYIEIVDGRPKFLIPYVKKSEATKIKE